MSTIHGGVDAATGWELHRLIVEFTWKLDHAEPAGFGELFEPDGSFTAAGQAHRGRLEIQGFADRRAVQERTTRSVLSNHRLVRISDSVIEGTVLVTLYLHDGELPGEPVAQAVTEYRDVYARQEHDGWRFRERRSHHILRRSS